MKVKKGDTVVVIAGKDRDAKGKVIAAYPKEQRVLVEGVNRIKKHTRITTTQRGAQTGGIVTQDLIESLARYFPRAVDVRRTTLGQKFVGTFRCQTYWLLATRGAWRVLWALATTGRFDPAKTDRVTR